MTDKNPNKAPLTPYGKWVKGRIIQTGLSVNELAEQIGVRPQNLSGMLHGRVPGEAYKPKIEHILGAPPICFEEVASEAS